MKPSTYKDYQSLVNQISDTYLQGQQKAVTAVNTHLVETYWSIGQRIVEFEQGGKAKAEYGIGLLKQLSNDLALVHGKGFSVSNVHTEVFFEEEDRQKPPRRSSVHLCSQTFALLLEPKNLNGTE
jgi:hypothetical protein